MKRILAGCVVAAAAAVIPFRSASADATGDQLKALVEKYAPSIVTVKLVVKTEMSFGGRSRDNESRAEMHGVVVDADGLIMLGGGPLAQDASDSMGSEMSLKVTPLDIKVVFDREEKEYPAFLAATDSKVGLAFLKVEELGDRKLPVVDFATAVDAVIGQDVAAIARQRKGYDYAPYFETGRVCGEIAKPRKAWMLGGGVGTIGLPVFSATGQVLGVLASVPDGMRDDEEGGGMGGFGGGGGGRGGIGRMLRMLGGGGGGLGGGFLLPGAPVKALIAQAKAKSVEVAAERAKQKEEEKKEGAEKKDEPKDEAADDVLPAAGDKKDGDAKEGEEKKDGKGKDKDGV